MRGADILVVEDDPVNQDLMLELLSGEGLRVRIAGNGREALRAVVRSRPDCVLMDCQMPETDGYAATRRLRDMSGYEDLPIIALTAKTLKGDREQCLAVGMNAFVSKPVDMTELASALMLWIRPREAPEPPAGATGELALAGVDSEGAVKRLNGRRDMYLKLLRSFRDGGGAGFRAEFDAALNREEWPLVTRLAHTLKGGCRNLGADALGDLAERMEHAARAGRLDEVRSLAPELHGELESLLDELHRLDRLDDAPPEPADADGEAAMELCRRLARLLEERDSSAQELLDEFASRLRHFDGAPLTETVVKAARRYDFSGALQHLTALAERLNFDLSREQNS